ncbi:MAG: hypothetical protein HOC74_44120 [Gemmatimonadetes bacterium]|jgi:hypothetical protein|nr:hypothetical protein [Gemmatimonadota bacterium]
MTISTSTPTFEVIPPKRQHLLALGFKSFRQYRHWCQCRGLVDGLKKSHTRLQAGKCGKGFQRPAPYLTPERRQLLEQIASGELPTYRAGLIDQWLGKDEEARQVLRQLLLHVDRFTNVLRSRRFYPVGRHRLLLHGLLVLSYHHRRWIRPLEEWHCGPSINGHPRPSDQFSSLLRHLLARYDVPKFMDAAFFEGIDARGLQQQEWFMHIANGGSIRDLRMPIKLTRRMAHLMLSMKDHYRYGIEHNMRWVQVIGMGGDSLLAKTILRTRLGRNFDDDAFWSSVVLFLVNNAMMDPGCVSPLIDYVYNMKFAPRRIVRPEGGVEEAPPPQPGFTMKGRSATKLLRQVDAWHGHLNREENVVFQSWQPCGLRPYEIEEETADLGPVRWTVQELLSSWELAAEGRAMSHCVVSYSDQCADGKTSIWSISVQRQEKRESVHTVAVDVQSRTITQARGRHNMLPNKKPRSNQEQKEVQSDYIPMLNRSAHILQLWAERESLKRTD